MVAASGCPRYYLFDAVAPRSRLAELMNAIRQAAESFELPVLNTFHAGDGNVHPTPFYDPDDPGHRARLSGFSTQVLRECRRMGGSLSGEHGIGTEKRELMAEFYPRDVLEIMRAVKRAADPENLCNPGKIVPPIGSPPAGKDSSVRLSMSASSRVNLIDAFIEIDNASVTFADVEADLADTPYELPYEPLGGTADQAVLAAIDLGLPALREPSPARPRDLILGAELQRDHTKTVVALGGRCAKDVAGYELRKLVYGGRGRLGILSAARLRLLPRPTDSRLIHGAAMTPDAAVTLCRRLRTLALPFRYLGVLITVDGAATVTGRLELTGGVLDRQLEILHRETSDTSWQVSTGNRWLDPVMQALADPTNALVGAPHVLTHRAGRLARLANHGRTVFISNGHGRTWWRGQPYASATSSGWLVDGVIGSFAAVRR